MIGPSDEIAHLNALTGGALIRTALHDFERLSDDLIAACVNGEPDAIDQARHALSGVCRIMGATSLEIAANGALEDPAAQLAFRECLGRTLEQISRLALATEGAETHG